MIPSHSFERHMRLPLALLGGAAALVALIVGLTPNRSAESKPAVAELAPMPRSMEAVSLYPEVTLAKNPVRLCLQDDGHKVLGWISGTGDYTGLAVGINAGSKSEAVTVEKGNTFVWKYKLDQPTKVSFHLLLGWMQRLALTDSITVAPTVAEKEPTVFFVIDRTAYRPKQTLNYAGFLRRLNAEGDFEPIANTTVGVELVSQQKQTKIFKTEVHSDESGKIAGSYAFTDADPLDTYTLRAPTYKGEAKLLLSEYRKSKVRLKISGDVKDEKLSLQFEAVDFLDKSVPAMKLSFSAQVVEMKKSEKNHALKAEDFAYYSPQASSYFEMDDLADDDRLLWLADNVMPQRPGRQGSQVVAQFNSDLALKGTEPGKYTIDLKKEWKVGHFSILVQGIVTDANGREQRATRSITLACESASAAMKLELTKEIFATGEKIAVKLTREDNKPVDAATSLVVMKLMPAAPAFTNFYGYGYSSNMYDHIPRNAYYGRRSWNFTPQQEGAKRTLVTAMPFRNDLASVKLSEPGAYKFVAITQHDDGRTTQTETGCMVKPSDLFNPLSLQLEGNELNAGDRLKGAISSAYANARLLLTLRDSSGIRFWLPITLNDKGLAQIDEKLPAELKYGCTVDLHYLDANKVNHVLSQALRINPKDRIIGMTMNMKDVVQPGETVRIDLQADRAEEVDLLVSVYDQSLLGINADKAVDIRNFYLADDRARTLQAADLLRRKLGDVTVYDLVKKAQSILMSDRKLKDRVELEMQQMVDRAEKQHFIYSTDLILLMHLAGIDVQLDPVWSHIHGQAWTLPLRSNLRVPLSEAVKYKHGEFTLVFDTVGDSLIVHEMHPSWAGLNIRQYADRYYGQQMQLGYGRSGFGGNFGGFGGGGFNGGTMNFGAANNQLRASANSSHSFMPEGQGFMSHLPGPGQAVEMINTNADQGHLSIRRDFSDSAYWNAQVRTDKNGLAQIEFKVPDSLTNWQVVATAVSKKMHVGQAKGAFQTFKPIMIWPMLPRSFSEGDVVELFGSVHNRTDKAQAIKVRLKVENGEILTPEEKTVQVAAKSSVNVYWTFRARAKGFAQLLMTADCDEGGDASLKRLPVLRAAAEQIITKSGQVRGGDIMLHIPPDVDLSSAQLELSFAPSLAADMADTLNFLVDYPYGCVEQTMSRFLPAIKVAQILKQYQVDNPELNKKLPGCVAGGIKRLLELQQPDGGWGWQGGSQTHEMMTPYALFGLLQAEKAGYTIPNEAALIRGLQRLKLFIDSMNDQQAADRIYCMYVWSHREKLDDGHWNFLVQMQKAGTLSDYANALCLEMCVAADRKDMAKKFAEDLRAKAQKAGGGQVYWKTAGFSRWMEEPHEITAAVMKALVALDKDDPLVDGILGYFAATKRGDRWNSTKDTAMILFAMCDYLAKANYNPEAKNELTFTLNGGAAKEIKFDDKLMKKALIAGEALKNGDNKITFATEMTGVMYRAVLRYWKAGRDIEPMDKGIKVERRFYRWDDKTKQQGPELKNGDSVVRGSYLICDTTATRDLPQPMPFMLMECPKPATAEVLPLDDARFLGLQSHSGYSLREERLSSVAFHHEQANMAVTNRVILLAELAGDYVVPPAFAELMYQTDTRGHSGTFNLKVVEEKK